jgi:septum formation protein
VGALSEGCLPAIVLASTSPQRRAILEQLGLAFEVVAPSYVEHDPPDADATALVRDHALGKARSVERDGLVLGVDTAVVLDGRVYSKPRDEEDATSMLRRLAGRTHEVLSGLCLREREWEAVEHERTRVVFRSLGEREIAAYVETGEWESRAGGYAIQGKGASLVERIEGDYLNVVGLPAALLVRLLAEKFPGHYGFG